MLKELFELESLTGQVLTQKKYPMSKSDFGHKNKFISNEIMLHG
jgi:hypothetical protein